VNFGAFPGSSEASVAVTGQATIVAGSIVDAWIRPEATADHTADEHIEEPIRIVAGSIVAATGFTIYARCENMQPEPYPSPIAPYKQFGEKGLGETVRQTSDNVRKLYGQFTVAWRWS
jgi:hypothetical protein